jgi:hypothetical protein
MNMDTDTDRVIERYKTVLLLEINNILKNDYKDLKETIVEIEKKTNEEKKRINKLFLIYTIYILYYRENKEKEKKENLTTYIKRQYDYYKDYEYNKYNEIISNNDERIEDERMEDERMED